MTTYTVTVGKYTNKKKITKDWLFIQEPGAHWGTVLLNPGQCAALLANIDTLTAFAGKAALVVLPAPAPSITPIIETPSQPVPPVVMPAPKAKGKAKVAAPEPGPDPKNAAGQTDITANLNPRVAALVQRAMGTKFASIG